MVAAFKAGDSRALWGIGQLQVEDCWIGGGLPDARGQLEGLSSSKVPLERFLRTLSQTKQRPFMAM